MGRRPARACPRFRMATGMRANGSTSASRGLGRICLRMGTRFEGLMLMANRMAKECINGLTATYMKGVLHKGWKRGKGAGKRANYSLGSRPLNTLASINRIRNMEKEILNGLQEILTKENLKMMSAMAMDRWTGSMVAHMLVNGLEEFNMVMEKWCLLMGKRAKVTFRAMFMSALQCQRLVDQIFIQNLQQ